MVQCMWLKKIARRPKYRRLNDCVQNFLMHHYLKRAHENMRKCTHCLSVMIYLHRNSHATFTWIFFVLTFFAVARISGSRVKNRSFFSLTSFFWNFSYKKLLRCHQLLKRTWKPIHYLKNDFVSKNLVEVNHNVPKSFMDEFSHISPFMPKYAKFCTNQSHVTSFFWEILKYSIFMHGKQEKCEFMPWEKRGFIIIFCG